MSIPLGHYLAAGGGGDTVAQKDLAAARADIQRAAAAPVLYAEDKVAKSMPGAMVGALDYRIATVACVKCGAKCDINQRLAESDETWSPNHDERLQIFGWQTDGERWFCGKWCGQMYAHQMREHGDKPLPVVARPNDQTYAKRMYAQAPTKAVLETQPPEVAPEPMTPAAPAQAPTQAHQKRR